METMIGTLIGISDVLCVTLSKLHNVSHHQLPLLKTEVILPILQDCCYILKDMKLSSRAQVHKTVH